MHRAAFFTPAEDEQLEAVNSIFWDSLIGHIRDDCQGCAPGSILDIGCHRGGLLARLAMTFRPEHICGIEPLATARARAAARLEGLAPRVTLLDVAGWPAAADGSFSLVTCHEVLYLEPDLSGFMHRLFGSLARSGRAYIVLGCHAENPTWAGWKPHIEALGHRVTDHWPMDILAAGAEHGLLPSVRPLRISGWVTHDPRHGPFNFPSVAAMLDHHFKHKLLFRFIRP